MPISEKHRFISYSRRYFGTQDWINEVEHFKTAVHANDLIEFIDALDTGPVHVVSWSSGVSTAVHTVLVRPDLFKSAVHCEPVDFGIFKDMLLDEDRMNDWMQR